MQLAFFCRCSLLRKSAWPDSTLFRSAATSTIRELQERNNQLDRHIGELRQAVLDALKGDKAVYEPNHPLHEGMLHDPVLDGINPGSSELMKLKHASNVTSCMQKVFFVYCSRIVASAHRKLRVDGSDRMNSTPYQSIPSVRSY
jgi:hypothetical protein